jgi:hypothetical protein
MPMSTDYLQISTNYSKCREKFLCPNSLVLKKVIVLKIVAMKLVKMVKQRTGMNDIFDVIIKICWA